MNSRRLSARRLRVAVWKHPSGRPSSDVGPSQEKKLQQCSWKVSDAEDLLELSETELCLVEMKLSLSARNIAHHRGHFEKH
jgi:hypothetical protein